ncbi:MAG: C13 family peptidase [Myxococcota bacterium]
MLFLVRNVGWVGFTFLLPLCACSNTPVGESNPCGSGELQQIGVLFAGGANADTVSAWHAAADWAVHNVNAYVQQTGVCLQAVVHKLHHAGDKNMHAVAQQLAADNAVEAVVAAIPSSQLVDIAHVLLAAKKPLVTPTATTAQLAHVIQNEPENAKFVWRSVGSDVMRAHAVLQSITAMGYSRMAVIATRDSKMVPVSRVQTMQIDSYGDTYADWIDLLAAASSMQLTSLQRADVPFSHQSCRTVAHNALALAPAAWHSQAKQPDVLVVAAATAQQITCIVQAVRELDRQIPILVTESIDAQQLTAEAVYSITPAAHDNTAFANAYQQQFARQPPAYAAQIYDAVLWIFYALVQKRLAASTRAADSFMSATASAHLPQFIDASQTLANSGFMALADAMQKNAQQQRQHRADSMVAYWGRAGIGQAVEAMQAGQPLQLGGAAGLLTFDPDLDIDPVAASYQLRRLAGQSTLLQDIVTVRVAKNGDFVVTSQFFDHRQNSAATADVHCGKSMPFINNNTQVLLLSSSYGWHNYRHQSDLLAVRHWLLTHGAGQENIVTIAADDLARHPQNAYMGSVMNRINGVNLYRPNQINYRLCGSSRSCRNAVTTADVLHILAGNAVTRKCLRKPCAIGSDAANQNSNFVQPQKSNLFIYLTGHAGHNGLYLDHAQATEPAAGSALLSSKLLRPEDLVQALQQLSFHRLFLAVDTCHAGIFGEAVARHALPNVVVLSATRQQEVSFSEFFDPQLHTPLGNQFTARWLDVLQRTPAVSLPSMLWQVARSTLGSHVQLYNASHFANLGCTRLVGQPCVL